MSEQSGTENGSGFRLTDEAIVERVREMAAIAREKGLAELTVSEGDLEISIQIRPVVSGAPGLTPGPRHRAAKPPAGEEEAGVTVEPGMHLVLSPMVGVFYRSPMPDAPEFISVGDTVAAGDIIGLVEAMKIFNEVATEADGEVVEILAGNEELVKLGQPLAKLRTAR